MQVLDGRQPRVAAIKFMTNTRVAHNEIRILRSLRHPNLPQLIDYALVDPVSGEPVGPAFDNLLIAVVTEFIPGRTMWRWIDAGVNANDGEPIGAPFPVVQALAAQLLSVVLYLHTYAGVAHRDIKPDNIIVDATGHLTLLDFGFAEEAASPDARTRSTCGTRGFMAQEIIDALPLERHQRHWMRAHQLDMYAVGMTIAVLMTGKWPRPSDTLAPTLSLADLLQRVRMTGHRFTGDSDAALSKLPPWTFTEAMRDRLPVTPALPTDVVAFCTVLLRMTATKQTVRLSAAQCMRLPTLPIDWSDPIVPVGRGSLADSAQQVRFVSIARPAFRRSKSTPQTLIVDGHDTAAYDIATQAQALGELRVSSFSGIPDAAFVLPPRVFDAAVLVARIRWWLTVECSETVHKVRYDAEYPACHVLDCPWGMCSVEVLMLPATPTHTAGKHGRSRQRALYVLVRELSTRRTLRDARAFVSFRHTLGLRLDEWYWNAPSDEEERLVPLVASTDTL